MIITVAEAAKEYFNGKISEWKLYDLIRQKKIPVLQISSRKHYFDTKALDKWVDGGCTTQEEEPQYGKLRKIN